MAKKRVYHVAKEFRISSEALIGMLAKLGVDVKSHMNTIDDETITRVKVEFEKEKEAVKQEYAKKAKRTIRGRHAVSKPAAAAKAQTTAAPAARLPEKAGKRRKKRKPRVDQKSVEQTVRRTLAQTDDRRPRKHRRRGGGRRRVGKQSRSSRSRSSRR